MRNRPNNTRMPSRQRCGRCSPHIAIRGAATIVSFVVVLAAAPWAVGDETALNSQTTAAGASATKPATKAEIEKLIRELGSPQFATRRAASNELRRIGPDAFDSLFAATEDSDPEIAASANYLLRQITVRWAHSDDSVAVRRILRTYGESADESRLADVLELALLPKREGLAALCRIARFDRSPLISRTAALAVIWPDSKSARRTPLDPDVIERELGSSTRIAAGWLRQVPLQLRDPASSVNSWQQLIDEESARLSQNSDETSAELLAALMWNLADVYRRLDNQAALVQIVDRMVRLEGDDPERVAVAVLMWLVDEKSWTTMDDLLNRHPDRFSRNKKPLYAAAIARKQQGRAEVAEELAEQASRLDTTEPLGGFEVAKDLEYRDLYEWAVREHRRIIDNERIDSHESIVARVTLAGMLHDHEEEQQAADVLAPLVQANANTKTASLYDQSRSIMEARYGIRIPERKPLAAQYHFYLACAHRKAENWKLERDELLIAIRLDPEDSDVLIAMYRATDANEEWKDNVRQRIANMERDFQKQIDAAPNSAQNYNQWAWLISNTEGDFQKAIRYSHKSLELNTIGESASASFLDTLGRCYFAAGDYENAVKYQRQAVEKITYLKTMQRQLDLFERTLAEKRGNGGSVR